MRYPTRLHREDLDPSRRRSLLPLPQANHSIKAATGQQVPTRVKGHCQHLTSMRQRLKSSATGLVPVVTHLPEPNCRICPCAGEQVSIWSKGQTLGVLLPARPEQSTSLHVPQFDSTIQTPTG